MKVSILTEGGKHVGFGHIARCVSIFEAFSEVGVVADFIINGDETVEEPLRDIKHRHLNWLDEDKEVFKIAENSDAVIIDSYLCSSDLYRKISSSACLGVYFDDNKRLEYPAGIIVNGNIYGKQLGYEVKGKQKHLLGCKYTPLRKAFWDISAYKTRDRLESIMLTFGGDDGRGMTPKILHELKKNYPFLKKKVIVAKAFGNIELIENECDESVELVYCPDAEGMKEAMLSADIAISTAGQTLYELARLGVPTIAIGAAVNQLESVKGWQEVGFIKYAGWWEDKCLCAKVSSYINEFEDFEQREHSSKVGSSLVDGKGARLIVDTILKEVGAL